MNVLATVAEVRTALGRARRALAAGEFEDAAQSLLAEAPRIDAIERTLSTGALPEEGRDRLADAVAALRRDAASVAELLLAARTGCEAAKARIAAIEEAAGRTGVYASDGKRTEPAPARATTERRL